MNDLGFIINDKKSHSNPTRELQFLGFVINSNQMEVRLPTDKVESILKLCRRLLAQTRPTIQSVAQVIGKFVSCFPAVPLGPLYYRNLEIAKDVQLKENTGNFQAKMPLTDEAKAELQWWILNLLASPFTPHRFQQPLKASSSRQSGILS